jgi:ATPase family associated with various cellular activities (AAA)
MPPRLTLRLVPADPGGLHDRVLLASADAPELTLRELLAEYPAFSLDRVEPAVLDSKLAALRVEVHTAPPGDPLYLPPSLSVHDFAGAAAEAAVPDKTGTGDGGKPTGDETPDDAAPVIMPHPKSLSERAAVLIAHSEEIEVAAGYLKQGMSVLIRCEKLLVEHLAQRIATLAERPARMIEVEAAGAAADPFAALGGGSRRSGLIGGLEKAVKDAVPGDMVVIQHLDLLGGGTDASLSSEGREITDLLYEHSDRVLLAFTDPSLTIPEVLASRFAVRIAMDILPREVTGADGTRLPIGVALVTREEADLFEGFDPQAFYKHVAGMNAVRLRHALRYALHEYRTDENGKKPTFDLLLHMLRMFKARNSATFELPNTHLADIGGYEDVKAELNKVLAIINGDTTAIPAHIRNELIPRGFIFHGPPGTGKTLFAKAIATEMGGTIQVVSGPEVTDMYVGESERKLRELFAEARRNAPAVLVFDEFDSIAAKRTGRDDGGSRAGNAVVAQLLTELDGFRPEVPVLIIGTTNRVDIIDEALLRPSRFREIKIGLPEEPEARRAIARIHARHFEVDVSDELLDAIANATNGMNGDEIRSIFRDAKANELVGDRRPAGAALVLGEMVGRLRSAQQSREAESRELSSHAGTRAVAIGRLTPVRHQTTAAVTVPADGEGDTR